MKTVVNIIDCNLVMDELTRRLEAGQTPPAEDFVGVLTMLRDIIKQTRPDLRSEVPFEVIVEMMQMVVGDMKEGELTFTQDCPAGAPEGATLQ